MIEGTGKLAPTGVRMSQELKDEVKIAATRAKWSLNTWIVEAIEEKLAREKKSEAA